VALRHQRHPSAPRQARLLAQLRRRAVAEAGMLAGVVGARGQAPHHGVGALRGRQHARMPLGSLRNRWLCSAGIRPRADTTLLSPLSPCVACPSPLPDSTLCLMPLSSLWASAQCQRSAPPEHTRGRASGCRQPSGRGTRCSSETRLRGAQPRQTRAQGPAAADRRAVAHAGAARNAAAPPAKHLPTSACPSSGGNCTAWLYSVR
jgi:hypothetical protein